MGKDFLFSSQVSFIHSPKVENYCKDIPFDPPERYPELRFIPRINKDSRVYEIVRELLKALSLDKENMGTPIWDPFKDIIKPGNTVLIKPNLVTHRHYLGKDALYSAVSHGSIIRPIIDYVFLALEGKGSIIIADNPVESTDFESLMEFTGIRTMVEELSKREYCDLEVLDLRPRVLKEAEDGKFYYELQKSDPLGYATINLGKDSLFAEFDQDNSVHYYTLADHTVDHFNPRYEGESSTDKYHNSLAHEYIVSKSVLDADVIINIAKMKTHCKAGVTLALKNMIGMVYEKECMPHHRPGLPPKGDSFPHYPPVHYVASRKLYKRLRENLQIHRVPGFRSFRNLLQKKGILIGQHIEHGNWKGNDTIWRTILDLNRIAIYADKNGIMQDTPQRKYFALIDGVIAQEGEGPMGGEPVVSSIVFGGVNPVITDALAIKSMGLDNNLIKTVSEAGKIKKWKLLPENGFDPSFPDMEVPKLNFKMPKGWN